MHILKILRHRALKLLAQGHTVGLDPGDKEGTRGRPICVGNASGLGGEEVGVGSPLRNAAGPDNPY